jgi:hypothetical protein
MIDAYKKIFSTRRIVPSFLTLEIVEKLYGRRSDKVPYGITELFESLPHPKPTFASFRKQLSVLEAAGCIVIQTSKDKASKKSVDFNEDFRLQLETDIYG